MPRKKKKVEYREKTINVDTISAALAVKYGLPGSSPISNRRIPEGTNMDYAEMRRKKYYTQHGEPRKVLECQKCETKTMKLVFIDGRHFISGTRYNYECTKCGREERHLL